MFEAFRVPAPPISARRCRTSRRRRRTAGPQNGAAELVAYTARQEDGHRTDGRDRRRQDRAGTRRPSRRGVRGRSPDGPAADLAPPKWAGGIEAPRPPPIRDERLLHHSVPPRPHRRPHPVRHRHYQDRTREARPPAPRCLRCDRRRHHLCERRRVHVGMPVWPRAPRRSNRRRHQQERRDRGRRDADGRAPNCAPEGCVGGKDAERPHGPHLCAGGLRRPRRSRSGTRQWVEKDLGL